MSIRIQVEIEQVNYEADVKSPIDISLPLKNGLDNPNCFFAPPVEFSPLVAGDFVGSVKSGSPVNFFNVRFNPHGNGTHTECLGHISPEQHSVNEQLRNFFFIARLISIFPEKSSDGDRIISQNQLAEFNLTGIQAIIIRTMPNDPDKKSRNWSGSNPPYLSAAGAQYLAEQGIQHLLIDLPSVDREMDEGALQAHKAFWSYPENPRLHCTITEMIYVPDVIKDGFYLLNLQIAPFHMDASPSKPVIYALKELG